MSSTTTTTAGTPVGPGTTDNRRRPALVAAVVIVLVVAGAVIWWVSSSKAKAPYADVRSTGALTLCDASGKPVTSGSTGRAPFVSRAVGVTAPKDAAAQHQTATLYAYQPRQGAESGEWSGQQLTAPASYTNAEHPMSEATAKDVPLKNFLVAFPPQWDGYVQLRLYLASDGGSVTQSYDSADLKIHGNSWKVVGTTGKASCTDGDAISSETSTPAT